MYNLNSIIKNAVLDATEAYVDARLDNLSFVKTQIGVVISKEKRADKKYYHTVRCNATRQNPSGITYKNVLSVGNTPFPNGCVVFLVAPNAQYSNQFILGQLDDTPVHITAGSIALGGEDGAAPIYLSGDLLADGSYGHIASFSIFPNMLKFTGENSAISFIRGTGFRISEFLESGGSGYRVSLMMDGNNARFAANTEGYPSGGLIVSNAQGWDSNGNFYPSKSGSRYINITPTGVECKTDLGEWTLGSQVIKFLGQSQDIGGDLGALRIYVGGSSIAFTNVYTMKSVNLTLS